MAFFLVWIITIKTNSFVFWAQTAQRHHSSLCVCVCLTKTKGDELPKEKKEIKKRSQVDFLNSKQRHIQMDLGRGLWAQQSPSGGSPIRMHENHPNHFLSFAVLFTVSHLLMTAAPCSAYISITPALYLTCLHLAYNWGTRSDILIGGCLFSRQSLASGW